MEALDYQKHALAEIVARARTYFRGHWRDLPIQPRWPTILVAQTGLGKTTTATMVARAAGVEASLLRLSVPEFIPTGASNRGARETITVIGEHIARHPRTLLVADEICKLSHHPGNDSAWLGYIRASLLEILDGRFPAGMREIEDENGKEVPLEVLTKKLRETVFILAIGTFQAWHDSSRERRAMGFATETIDDPQHDQITPDILAQTIPREIVNRFGKIIQIPQLKPHDYLQIAQQAEAKLPEQMRELFRNEIEARIPEAIAAKKGARFIEEALTSVLINMPEPAPSKSIMIL